MKKQERGITLIALVVTIIVLVILAGVSINLVLGENGLITKAKEARIKQNVARLSEKLELLKGSIFIDSTTVSFDKYILELENITEEYKINYIDRVDENNAYIVLEGKYKFLLKNKENIDVEIIYDGIDGTIRDDIAPNLATIEITGSTSSTNLPVTLNAKVTHIDNESGINIEACKYILNTSSDSITDTSTYTGTFNENEKSIPLELTSVAEYYLHVLSVDNEENATETIKGPIIVLQSYHKHIDVDGTVQESDYKANLSGGCFTKSNIVYGTRTENYTCGGKIVYQPSTKMNQCEMCGKPYSSTGTCSATLSRNVQYDTGNRYYTVNCNKTTSTEEGYKISY